MKVRRYEDEKMRRLRNIEDIAMRGYENKQILR